MKSRLALAATWIGSNNRFVKTVVVFGTLALSLIGAGIAGAGNMPAGPDVP